MIHRRELRETSDQFLIELLDRAAIRQFHLRLRAIGQLLEVGIKMDLGRHFFATIS